MATGRASHGATTRTSPAFWPTWTKAPRAGRSSGSWPWSSAPAARPEQSSTHWSSRGFEHIAIANRTQARAEALAAHFGGSTDGDILGGSGDGIALRRTCSSMRAPLAWSGSRRLRSMSASCRSARWSPTRSMFLCARPLIEAASARGLRTVEGLGMLLHQAAPAFARWFGREPR